MQSGNAGLMSLTPEVLMLILRDLQTEDVRSLLLSRDIGLSRTVHASLRDYFFLQSPASDAIQNLMQQLRDARSFCDTIDEIAFPVERSGERFDQEAFLQRHTGVTWKRFRGGLRPHNSGGTSEAHVDYGDLHSQYISVSSAYDDDDKLYMSFSNGHFRLKEERMFLGLYELEMMWLWYTGTRRNVKTTFFKPTPNNDNHRQRVIAISGELTLREIRRVLSDLKYMLGVWQECSIGPMENVTVAVDVGPLTQLGLDTFDLTRFCVYEKQAVL